tara:strand:- start:658 stop:1182 length:525 start_codon:yes stop_codon:yes gene_type:complete
VIIKKNMKLGNQIKFLIFLIFANFQIMNAEEKITSSQLLNLDEIKPSFEELDGSNENLKSGKDIKNKKKKNINSNLSHAVIIGLDKITAKSTEIMINLNESKIFGPLEIKILKCGKIKINNKLDDVAYMQVKDLSKNEDEKVFIFNGWTFSSDPNLMPFDHAIYDLQLLNCYNV